MARNLKFKTSGEIAIYTQGSTCPGQESDPQDAHRHQVCPQPIMTEGRQHGV